MSRHQRCRACTRVQEMKRFSVDRRAASGHRRICKDCQRDARLLVKDMTSIDSRLGYQNDREKKAAWYQENRAGRIAYQKRWNKANPKKHNAANRAWRARQRATASRACRS